MTEAAPTFRIFVSSTFTDLKAERDHLHSHVFPRLRSLCRQHGARFQAIDLRWGVSEEAGLDQQTMRICLGEIARCQKTTPRPNFIVLLGDRYGWRPLPETVPAAEFNDIASQLRDPEREELRKWYRRDSNAIPAIYALQARTGVYEEQEEWIAVERRLHALFGAALESLSRTVTDRQKFELSAVEQEIAAGALAMPDAGDHVFCFFRRIVDMPRNSSAAGFVELIKLDPGDPATWTTDPDSEARVKALKDTLRRALPGNCFEYEAKWTGSGGVASITTGHLDQLGEDVYSTLAGIINAELAKGAAIDELDHEIAAHARFGAERARTFIGRADIIARINSYLTSVEPRPLVVYGAPGSGKSALLARIAEQARSASSGDHIFVIRFLGATPDSSDVRSMLLSLCRQISRAYGASEGGLPADFRGLVQKFPECLALATADRPLILILDALDQLSETDNARTLTWLPAELPSHVSMIVSILGRECPEVVKEILPGSSFVPMTAMTAAEGDALLHEWLSRDGRTLQDEQREEVRRKFAAEGLPLYLRLAFEEARRWPSFLPAARTQLSPDIPGLIQALFDRLASPANHGPVLVARSLGCLAAARNGLTEDELLDVLSPPYDTDVLSDLRRRSPNSPAVDRLPVVLWSRMFFDLAPYLSERSADGTSLMTFYHRQFQEAAQRAFVGAPHDSRDSHRRVAGYFAAQKLEYIQDNRRILNLRALAELPYQQTYGDLWPELFATLTDFRFLQNKATTGQQFQRDVQGEATTNYTGVYDLQADFELALQRWPGGMKAVTTAGKPLSADQCQDVLAAFARALQQEAHILVRRPDLIWQQLHNRLQSGSGPIPQVLAVELERRGVSGATPWFQLKDRLQESETLLRTITGHTSSITACAVSPDGTWIVSAGEDRVLRIWDSRTGRERIILKGHSMAVTACAITADGERIVSAGGEYPLRIWDSRTGAEHCSLFGHVGSLSSCVFAPDGSFVVSADWDGFLRLWDKHGRARATLIGHSKRTKNWTVTHNAGTFDDAAIAPDSSFVVASDREDTSPGVFGGDSLLRVWDSATGIERTTLRGCAGCAISSDSSYIVSAAENYTLRIWDSRTGRSRAVLAGHKAAVTACAIAPDSTWIVSGDKDGSVRIWDSRTGAARVILTGHDNEIAGCAVPRDGTIIVTLDQNRILKVWDSRDGRELATLRGRARWTMYWTLTSAAGTFAYCAVSPDGSFVVAGDDDGTLRVWDITGSLRFSLQGHTSAVTACAVSPDSSFIVSVSSPGSLRVWDSRTGQLRAASEGMTSRDSGYAVSPDGSFIVCGGANGSVQILDSATGRVRAAVRPHTNAIDACSVSSDGSCIVSAAEEHPLRLWDRRTGRELASLRGHTGKITACAVSPDGSFFVSGADDATIRIWNSVTLEEQTTIKVSARRITACAVSPDSSFVVAAGDDACLRIFDSRSGAELATLKAGVAAISACAVSPDGTWIVAALTHEYALKIWDSRTGAERATLNGHAGPVTACAVSLDGAFIVSGGQDCTVRIWDTASGTEWAIFKDHDEPVTSCAVGPDGRWIVSASKDQTLKMWTVPTKQFERAFDGHRGKLDACAFGPDGTWFVTVSGSDMAIWDTAAGEVRRRLALSSERAAGISACQISPDGTWVVLAQEGMRRKPYGNVLSILDAGSGRERAVMSGHYSWVRDCAISPDGSFVVSASDDGSVRFWDSKTWQPLPVPLSQRETSGRWPRLWDNQIHTLLPDAQSFGEGEACCLSPDGSWVVVGNYNGKLSVLDVWTGRKSALPDGHTERITGCAVAPDGAFMVSSSADRTLKIWGLPAGRERATLRGHDGPVTGCSISPDGRYVFSISADSSLRMWDAADGGERAMLALPASLTCLAIHPWRPFAMCGDAIGNVYQSVVKGVEYGPILATAIRSGSALILRCPFCRDSFPVEDEFLGKPMSCGKPGCGGSMRVNSFVG